MKPPEKSRPGWILQMFWLDSNVGWKIVSVKPKAVENPPDCIYDVNYFTRQYSPWNPNGIY